MHHNKVVSTQDCKPGSTFKKSINVIRHNRIKMKNYAIISIEAEKTCDKMQQSLMIKKTLIN